MKLHNIYEMDNVRTKMADYDANFNKNIVGKKVTKLTPDDKG